MYSNFSTQNHRHLRRLYLAAALVLLVLGLILPAQAAADVTADVVAIDQVLVYNRMGAFNPAGMMFALSRDVFPKGTSPVDETLANSCASGGCTAGNVQLRSTKRPRPLTLRVNEGEKITIKFTNLLAADPIVDADNAQPPGIQLPDINSEQPDTRDVSIHINGMQPMSIADDGSKVGPTQNSLVGTRVDSTTYTLYAEKEGAYTITSGPNLGGQGGSGAIASGLFGVLNVEPADSEWYRSQLTRAEMDMATTGTTDGGQPILNYDAVYPGAVVTTSTHDIVAGVGVEVTPVSVEVTPVSMDNIRIGSVLKVSDGTNIETVRVKSVTADHFHRGFRRRFHRDDSYHGRCAPLRRISDSRNSEQ